MDWLSQFEQWHKSLAEHKFAEANRLLEEARKSIPKSKGNDKWQWFVNALQSRDTCGFVACVFAQHPIPKTLMEPFLIAGIQFGDASTIKSFVVPCLESFGVEAVDDWFIAHELNSPSVQEKAEMARYWYSSAKTARYM